MKSREKSLKKGSYSVLIVCEGENTEPAYFLEFEKYLNETQSELYPNGITFTIFPFPPENEIRATEKEQLFQRAKKVIKVKNPATIINEDIEKKFLAEPIRWVRYAQKQADGAGYNQIWSIFDYDNRPLNELKKAFELAKNKNNEGGVAVDIAYSSYSFEYWLLLHYEMYEKFIGGSECKDENEDAIDCGVTGNTKKNNCKGASCLGGYLRLNSYKVGFFNKTKKSTFPDLIPLMKKARFNAAYTRSLPVNIKSEIWECKPITTMDKLVDSLMQPDYFIVWSHLNGKILAPDIEMEWTKTKAGNINIEIHRKGKKTVVIPEGKIKLLNSDYEEFNIKERVELKDKDTVKLKTISVTRIKIIPVFISIEISRKVYLSKIDKS